MLIKKLLLFILISLMTTVIYSELLIDTDGYPSTNFNFSNTELKNSLLKVLDYYHETFVSSYNTKLVHDPSQEDYSVSEASGYGLYMYLWANKRPSFDALWSGTESKLQKSNKLFRWKVDKEGYPFSQTAATDADEDIALALIFADSLKRNGYWSDSNIDYGAKAQEIIDSIYQLETKNGYLLPDDTGYNSDFNPSYFSPATYRIFAQFDQSITHDWKTIIDKGYEVINANDIYNKGLVSDWCKRDGTTSNVDGRTSGPSKKGYDFWYDAIRMPWRLALDSLWYKEDKAISFLDKSIRWVSADALTFYKLNGERAAIYVNGMSIAMWGAGAVGSTDKNKAKIILTKMSDQYNSPFYGWEGDADKYYNQSLSWLGVATMLGVAVDVYSDLSTSPSIIEISSKQMEVGTKNIFYVNVTDKDGWGNIKRVSVDIIDVSNNKIEILYKKEDGKVSVIPANIFRSKIATTNIYSGGIKISFESELLITRSFMPGTLNIRVYAEDMQGNSSSKVTNSYYYNRVPSVHFTASSEGSTLPTINNGATVDFSIDYFTADTKIDAKLIWEFSNGDKIEKTTTETIVYKLPVSVSKDWIVTLNVIDFYGYKNSFAAKYKVKAITDNISPRIVDISSENMKIGKNNSFYVKVTDNNGWDNIKRVSVDIIDVSNNKIEILYKKEDGKVSVIPANIFRSKIATTNIYSGGIKISFESELLITRSFMPGTLNIRVYAEDMQGNSSSKVTNSYYYNRVPSVHFTASSEGSTLPTINNGATVDFSIDYFTADTKIDAKLIWEFSNGDKIEKTTTETIVYKLPVSVSKDWIVTLNVIDFYGYKNSFAAKYKVKAITDNISPRIVDISSENMKIGKNNSFYVKVTDNNGWDNIKRVSVDIIDVSNNKIEILYKKEDGKVSVIPANIFRSKIATTNIYSGGIKISFESELLITRSFMPGTLNIRVYAEDMQGNSSSKVTNSYYYNRVPSVHFTASSEGSTLPTINNGATVDFSIDYFTADTKIDAKLIWEFSNGDKIEKTTTETIVYKLPVSVSKDWIVTLNVIDFYGYKNSFAAKYKVKAITDNISPSIIEVIFYNIYRNSFVFALLSNGDLWGAIDLAPADPFAYFYNHFQQETIIPTKNWTKVLSKVKSISSGSSHGLALKEDGTLWATGYNSSGQLGDNTNQNKYSWKQVLSEVKKISAGNAHSLALKENGTLWATGLNCQGQLGDGTNTGRKSWKQVLTEVIDVSGGGIHSLAIKKDGTLWATGYNSSGQLGDSNNQNKYSWKQVFSSVKQISAGSAHSIALKKDGTVWATGWNIYGQLGDATNTRRNSWKQVFSSVKQISAGAYHSLALKENGTVWATGWNIYGQLGDGILANKYHWKQILNGVKRISGKTYHSLALKENGTLWTAGWDAFGRLAGVKDARFTSWKKTQINLQANSKTPVDSVRKPISATFSPTEKDAIAIKVSYTVMNLEQIASINLITPNTRMQQREQVQNDIYDIRILDKSGNFFSNVQLNSPVTIRIPYYGTQKNQVYLKYFDEDLGIWRKDGLRVIFLNTVENFILVETMHLSKFSIFSYNDHQAPVIDFLKVNNTEIQHSAEFSKIVNLEVKAKDDQDQDTGISSLSIIIKKDDNLIMEQSKSNTKTLKDMTCQFFINQEMKEAGQYQLELKIVDDVGNINIKNYEILVADLGVLENFLIGPNPVNINKSNIHFYYFLNKETDIKVYVYDVSGRIVQKFEYIKNMTGAEIGANKWQWDGSTDYGGKLPTGVYLVYIIYEKNKSNKFTLMVVK